MVRSKKETITTSSQPAVRRGWILTGPLRQVVRHFDDFLSRRPHRSFRLTRRRDYVRSLVLPGYWSFSIEVGRVLYRYKRLFIGLTAFYVVAGFLLIGLASQATYSAVLDSIEQASQSGSGGSIGALASSGALLLAGVAEGLSPQLSDVQQVYAVLIFLLTWLTCVWLLRSILAGFTPKLRDGLYNAGGPIVVTGIIAMVLLVQFVPAAVAVIAMTGMSSAGILANGFIAMIASFVVVLLIVLSFYWATGTFIALVISTLPGMYPWHALRSAGDVVTGRRVRIMLRIMWLLVLDVAILVVVMLPIVMIDAWAKRTLESFASVPVVPFVISVLGAFLTVWSAAYIYLLYRKVVQDEA